MALNPNILLTNYTSNPLRIGKKISGQEDFLAPEFSCQKRGELLSVPQSSPVAFVCYCPHSAAIRFPVRRRGSSGELIKPFFCLPPASCIANA